MENKGLAEMIKNIDTPDDVSETKRTLKEKEHQNSRVDINVLKSKLQESEDNEFKKNVLILFILVLGLIVMGIYLSL
mgnify:CR=1 FL=1|tara:strand:- start:353 stop:583 length:231 start_codon:yes stop_codon:yes gene_type:complete